MRRPAGIKAGLVHIPAFMAAGSAISAFSLGWCTFSVITGLVPVIDVLLAIFGAKDVDGRVKPGHDELD